MENSDKGRVWIHEIGIGTIKQKSSPTKVFHYCPCLLVYVDLFGHFRTQLGGMIPTVFQDVCLLWLFIYSPVSRGHQNQINLKTFLFCIAQNFFFSTTEDYLISFHPSKVVREIKSSMPPTIESFACSFLSTYFLK